ncbi:MAG TPA: class I mannose-6-phosphate isomerase [Sphingomicrobium sp.]
MKLNREFIEKPWGRTKLPLPFPSSGERIGEVWFTSPEPLPLLVKYLFTSERLSIQVHPDDDQARERGVANGKTECWYILDAEPGATLGLGLVRDASKDELRAAALDGSIEQLMNWRPVSAGDFLFVPAGTIHAVGAGISLLEFQQNEGVTYRLYDYGRPRELHLDDGMEVSQPITYPEHLAQQVDPANTRVLVQDPHFSLVHVADGNEAPRVFAGRRRWVMPLDGVVHAGSDEAGPGECLLLEPDETLDLSSGRVLIGA